MRSAVMSYLCLVVVLCSRYTNLTQHEPDTSIWSLYGRVFCVYTNQWLSYIPTANHKYRRSRWIIIQTNHSVAHTLIYLGQACVMSVAKDFRAYRWVSLVSGKQESSIHEMRTVRSSWKRRIMLHTLQIRGILQLTFMCLTQKIPNNSMYLLT